MRKMKIALSPGSIGVESTQEEAIGLAHYFGYAELVPRSEGAAAGRRDPRRHLDHADS